MVVVAVTATVAALGIGTVYLPFIADRDKVRGLHEEGEMSDRDRREMEKVLKEMGAAGQELRAELGQDAGDKKPNQQRSLPTSNSMWKRMNDAAAGKRE